jgi:BMFP domain-containing protein YqiC
LLQDGFREVVLNGWPERGEKRIQDHWRDVRAAIRKFCKGWGANINNQMRREKKDLLTKLQIMDREADMSGLDGMRWKERYEVEEQLELIYQFEEFQWQRRGG